jgi:hypothetical protein
LKFVLALEATGGTVSVRPLEAVKPGLAEAIAGGEILAFPQALPHSKTTSATHATTTRIPMQRLDAFAVTRLDPRRPFGAKTPE